MINQHKGDVNQLFDKLRDDLREKEKSLNSANQKLKIMKDLSNNNELFVKNKEKLKQLEMNKRDLQDELDIIKNLNDSL